MRCACGCVWAAWAALPLTPGAQELGYYQRKKLEEFKQKKAEQEKRESRTLDKLMRQVAIC